MSMRIIHINQAHKPALANPPQEIIDEIIRSQFQVGQELKKYTGYPILLESLHKDLSDASSFSLEMAKISLSAKILFPEGFPKNFSNLDPIQKNFLYDQGVVFTLFYLGEIPVLYKSIHGEVRNNVDQLLKLNEEQVISIKHKFKDEALQTKVEDYINQNHKRKRI